MNLTDGPCPRCGRDIGTIGICTNLECQMARQREASAPIGWRCPVCGGGMSPTTTRCPCVPAVPPIVTVTGSSSLGNDATFEATIPVAQDDTTGIG